MLSARSIDALHESNFYAGVPRTPKTRQSTQTAQLCALAVLARRRDWEPAWKKYETSTELAEREYRDEPNEQTRADLLWVLERHAEAAVQRGEPATARNRWTRALEVLRPEVVNPASPEGSRAKAIEERLRQIRE